MATKGICIYGIVPNFYGADLFRSLENSGVYVISFQAISAIVSDRENTKLDSLDRESLARVLVHHQQTIEELQSKGFTMIIPMRLGTIISSKGEVIKILANGYDVIMDTLKEIEYLTEIDLAVTWNDFPGILTDIADNPAIKSMKEDLLKKDDIITKVDQYKMGLLVQQKLDEKNKEVELKILDSLSSISLDIKTHEVMNDQMVTNTAFLLNRNNNETFEKTIDQLDQEYEGALNFKLVGPLPCYSFYTIEVKELNPELVEQAKNELGLKEEVSEDEIKKAYLEKAKEFHPDACLNNGDKENFNRINNAYHTLLDYSAGVRQSSKEGNIFLSKEKVLENLILVKIKE
ncbi:MAG: GvpL/GvpF family gas vesicle protein [Bacteroidales bacterium]|nr:GvpL/GvpF family gas vesicle protein [Bacteroidales bacterium]